jgi:hypothetical protein
MNESDSDHLSDLILAGQIARIVKRDRSEVLRAMRSEPGMRRLALANRRRRQQMAEAEISDDEAERLAREDAEGDDKVNYELRRKAFTMPDRQQVLRGLMKSAGGDVVSLAKWIVRDNGTDVSEAELTSLIVEHAKRLYPGLGEAQAFAKLYESEEPLRRAIKVCKGAAYPATPRIGQTDAVGGQDALDTVGDDADESAALDELTRLAVERVRRAEGKLTYAQAFAQVYSENAGLAKRERAHAYAKLRGAA